MSFSLTFEDQQALLKIARQTLEAYLQTGQRSALKSNLPHLQIPVGAFVTLHRRDRLRGCIGHVMSSHPLYETVQEVALAAATEDSRFEPVRKEELSEIEIEISVLSPFEKIKKVEEVEVGKHGLLLTRGHHRGLLLPQVATEQGWDRDTFLTHTCLKAGLPPEAWKDPRTIIEIFSAQVFGENLLDNVIQK